MTVYSGVLTEDNGAVWHALLITYLDLAINYHLVSS